MTTIKIRKRLLAAVDRYHCGPGVYGPRYLATCLRIAGLRITLAPTAKKKVKR